MKYLNMPMEDYLKHPAIGSSELKYILHSPADFAANRLGKRTDTKATALGTAIDCALLEPDQFDQRYAVQTEDWGPKNKNPGYSKWKEFQKLHAGKTIIEYDNAKLLDRIRDAAERHRGLQEILRGSMTQTSAFLSIENVELKARADLIAADDTIWDLKSTSRGISDRDISNTIFSMGYHFQAAHYLKVFGAVKFGWIFVSTDTPAPHIITRLASETLLANAKRDHDYAVARLIECKKLNEWEGYDDSIAEIGLPSFVAVEPTEGS